MTNIDINTFTATLAAEIAAAPSFTAIANNTDEHRAARRAIRDQAMADLAAVGITGFNAREIVRNAENLARSHRNAVPDDSQLEKTMPQLAKFPDADEFLRHINEDADAYMAERVNPFIAKALGGKELYMPQGTDLAIALALSDAGFGDVAISVITISVRDKLNNYACADE